MKNNIKWRKKMKRTLGLVLLVVVSALLIVSCATKAVESESVAPMNYTEMVKIAGQTVTTSVGKRAFANAAETPVVITPSFEIGKYEVTYELWYTVYEWATSEDRGAEKYSFAVNSWVKPETDFDKYLPIVNVNWRDALIWLNAYTEFFNAVYGTNMKCVYYSDEQLTKPIRIDDGEPKNDSTVNRNPGSIDNPYVDDKADGYRFPSYADWEFVARGGDPTAADWEFTYSGSNTAAEVAWTKENSGVVSHTVGTLAPNRLGIYDMSGNVFEWCFDWREEAKTRFIKGGSFDKTEDNSAMDGYGYNAPGLVNASRGLRVVRILSN